MIDSFALRLRAELLAGMLDIAADATTHDAQGIEAGLAEPYDKETLIKFLKDLGETFKMSAEAIRFALDDKS